MTEVLFEPSEDARQTPAVRVYTRAIWSDGWSLEDNLFCDFVEFTANPDLPRAQFTWRYGRLMLPGTDFFQFLTRFQRLRWFVKVEIDDPDSTEDEPLEPRCWYGITEVEATDFRGKQATLNTLDLGAGHQTISAVGLEIMLARHILTQSVAGEFGQEFTVDRALEFNARAQLDGEDRISTGNRSAEPGADLLYVFATDLSTAQYWSTKDAVQYLLYYFAPPNSLDEVEMKWDFRVSDAIADYDKPRKPCHGRSLKQMLDEFLNHRRLVGYSVTVDVEEDVDDVIVLEPFTFVGEDLDFEGDIVPANESPKELVFDADSGLVQVMVRSTTMNKVDQVVAQGDRIVSCFSISALWGSIVAHWTEEQKDGYDAGASETSGYDALDISEQQARNARARQLDHVKRAYSYFGLPDDWDGQTRPELPLSNDPYFPAHEDNPESVECQPFYLPQMRFRHSLPLKTDHDYTGSKIADDEVTDNTPVGQKWEYLPPIVAIQIPESSPTRYHHVDRLANPHEQPDDDLGLVDGQKWAAGIRMQDDGPGFVLTVSGQPQHILAGSDTTDPFVPLDADEELGKFDWDTLEATIAVDVDKFAEGVWPETVINSEAVRRLVIDVGDEFQAHYVAVDTMVGINPAGEIDRTDSAGFIRDDRPRLQAIARLLYEWHSVERRAIDLTFAYVHHRLEIGDFITTIGSGDTLLEINSVVTTLRYDFSESPGTRPGPARVTISTEFVEPDAKTFLGL